MVRDKKYYRIFKEWYQDYKLYHYIGYLSSIQRFNIFECVTEWDNKTKTDFVEYIKGKIVEILRQKKWILELPDYKFDQEGKANKREVVDILLLHNIETIVQQNEKLIEESKYNLPNCFRFPFHLYKRENWQVEHIRPNSGDDLKKEESRLLYLSLAKKYLNHEEELVDKIDKYLNKEKINFDEILTEIWQKGGALSDDDKNKIYNFVLLDESTNKEYGNQIFPVKRAFIANKEKGLKIHYSYSAEERLKEDKKTKEISFVPPCTKNVFSKFYTVMPSTMVNWNEEDAKLYWNDMYDKLKYYFKRLESKR